MRLDSILQLLQSNNHDTTICYHASVCKNRGECALASTEFNQSGSYFACFSQKNDETHYRENVKTQDDDTFKSVHSRKSIENSNIAKDLMTGTVCAVMDVNQPPSKVTSKLNLFF